MSPGQTCSACRGRKVRCDGATPTCAPCSKTRRPVICKYGSTFALASTSKGDYLKKGAACAPCRKKKKKCDAKRPFCSTCKVAGKESDCTYDENERTLTEALFLRTHVLEQRLAAYENQVPATPHPSSSLTDHELSIASLEPLDGDWSFFPQRPQQSSYYAPMYNFPQALNVLFDRLTAPPPMMDVQNISTPHIPHDFEDFRSIWAEHARQIGCVLSTEKLQAVLAGDTSGTVVHPSFIYLSQLVGCLLWQVQRHTFIFATFESEQLEHLLGTLLKIDPLSELEVHYMLAIYFLLKRRMQDGGEQLMLAIEIVRQHNLTFPMSAEAYDPLQMQEVTSDQAELITALAELIYLDRCSSFVFRVPMRLDKSFDEGLKDVAFYHPYFANTNLVYLRACSLLYLLRVRDLSYEWTTISAASSNGVFSAARPAWFDAYWALLEELAAHVASLEGGMLKATFYGEREQAVAFKFCLVVALSGKAQLHWLVRAGHPESAQRALDAVMEVIGVTKTFKDNEFVLLDPLLGVCWSNVAKIVLEILKCPSLVADGGVSWRTALQTIDMSAKKLGCRVPFMEEPLQVISDVIRIVDVT